MNISEIVVERMTYIKQGENFKVLPMKSRGVLEKRKASR